MDTKSEPQHEHSDHEHVSKHVRLYLLIGAALLGFTALTVGLSYVDFGTPKANMIVAMFVATLKAGHGAAATALTGPLNMALFRVIGLTMSVLIGGVGGFALYLRRRARMAGPRQAELAHLIQETQGGLDD